jgi:hypothetical protein
VKPLEDSAVAAAQAHHPRAGGDDGAVFGWLQPSTLAARARNGGAGELRTAPYLALETARPGGIFSLRDTWRGLPLIGDGGRKC